MMKTGRGAFREVDRGWKALVNTVRLLKEHGSYVKVGVLAGSGGDSPADQAARKAQEGRDLAGRFIKRGGGGDADRGGITNAELAAVLEYGTADGHIPARPFVGSTIEAKRDDYYAALRVLLEKVYEGRTTLERCLDIIGAKAANDIKRAVTSGEGIPPPNAPSTIAAKGSSRPLVDTGRLIGSVSWLVVMLTGKGGGSDAQ